MPTVKAIFFDAVGTLLFPEPAPAKVYHAIGQRYGSRLDLNIIRQRFHECFQREEERDEAAGHRTDEDRERRRWCDIVAGVLRDCSDPEACFEELYEHFARPRSWRVHEEAADVVRQLRERGLKLGMASNYDHRLRRILAGLPELAPLERVIVSAEVGWKKPAPEFFAKVVESCGESPGSILMVGDTLENDYLGAVRAGLRAALLDPRDQPVPPGIVRVRRLRELLTFDLGSE